MPGLPSLCPATGRIPCDSVFDDYLIKPINMLDLVTAIAENLKSAEKAEEKGSMSDGQHSVN